MQNDNSKTPVSNKVDTQTTPVNPQDSSSNDWALYENTLYIHKKLMELGIVTVVSAAENESLTLIDEHHIVIDDQRDISTDPQKDPKKRQVLSYSSISTHTELSQKIGMTPGVKSGLSKKELQSPKQSIDLLNKLKTFANIKPTKILRTCEGNVQFHIINLLCNDEVFLPLSINPKKRS